MFTFKIEVFDFTIASVGIHLNFEDGHYNSFFWRSLLVR